MRTAGTSPCGSRCPPGGDERRELVYLACDQLYKILLPRFSTPRAQLELLDQLEDGACTSVVQLYTPCGGSGSRSSGRLTRPWRKRISSGAGAPWPGGTGSGGSPGGGGGETYGQIEKNRCFSGASGHFGRRRGSAVLGPGAECRSILTSGVGEGNYLLTASDAEGKIYALGRTETGYQLVIGTRAAGAAERWTLEDGTVPQDSTPALLYPAAGGAVYLGTVRHPGGDPAPGVYRVTGQGREAELASGPGLSGGGASGPDGGHLSVRLCRGGQRGDLCGDPGGQRPLLPEDQRLQRSGGGADGPSAGLRTALALPDGALALASGDQLVRTDRACDLPGGRGTDYAVDPGGQRGLLCRRGQAAGLLCGLLPTGGLTPSWIWRRRPMTWTAAPTCG